MNKVQVRIIAFYLPQFHPIPENDLWWGKGFTEWTNVGKAKPLFPGHKQPKVPTDLGYYDLRLIDNIKEQVKLAKDAGIEGFCWWHYYFGNGKMLLEKPLRMVLNDKSVDFPFCFGWANESWEKKLWNKDSTGNTILIEQKYGGEADYRQHFEIVLPYFKDSRYIKVDGKPLFFIYRPQRIPDCKQFISYWRKWAVEELNTDIHFVAKADELDNDFEEYYNWGFDGVFSNRVLAGARIHQNSLQNRLRYITCKLLGLPRLVNFKEVIKHAQNKYDEKEGVYPGILCGWDHSPRSGRKGIVIYNFTMKLFAKHISEIFELVKNKNLEHRIIFLKSWNEWGEGNFMEPDMEFGHGKINTLKHCLEKSGKIF